MPVYFIQAENGLIKIGASRTITSLSVRLQDLESMSPLPFTILGIIPNDHKDHRYHRFFSHLRHHGEWFNPGQDLLKFISQQVVEYTLEGKRTCQALKPSGQKCGLKAEVRSMYCTEHQISK